MNNTLYKFKFVHLHLFNNIIATIVTTTVDTALYTSIKANSVISIFAFAQS